MNDSLSLSIPCSLCSASAEQTELIGRTLADRIASEPTLPPFVALYGDLGVGKTAFVRGFTSRFAPSARVKSPTFSLVNEYRGEDRSVFHFDLYRIEDEEELYSIGFYDYLDRNGICLTEWSEHIPYALPDCYLRVTITKDEPADPDHRSIAIEQISR